MLGNELSRWSAPCTSPCPSAEAGTQPSRLVGAASSGVSSMSFLFAMVGTLIYVAGGPLWVALVIESIYVIGCVHVWGRTLGKLIVGTLVVTTDDGGRPNWRASVLRWAPAGWAWGLAPTDSIVVDVLRAVAVIVVYFPVLRDPDGRGVHDQLAGTIVLRARQ